MSFVFVAVVALCTSAVYGQVTQQEIDQIVSIHNAARSAVSPPASNMQQMVWDAQLAASAQSYANTCPSGHSGTQGVGENLAWGWPSQTATSAVSMWSNEKTYYSYTSNNCQSGQSCGHYTQMIWATSTKLGCGKKHCSSLNGHGAGDVWVCQYSPAGNYVGQAPYKTGTTCSLCPTGSSCIQNQCSTSPQTSANQVPASPTSPSATVPGQPSPVTPAMPQQPSTAAPTPVKAPSAMSQPVAPIPGQAASAISQQVAPMPGQTPSGISQTVPPMPGQPIAGSGPMSPQAGNQPVPAIPSMASNQQPGPGPVPPQVPRPASPARSMNWRRGMHHHRRRY